MRALRGRLSGLCLPEYVLDIPGGFGKVPIGPGFALAHKGGWQIVDPWGAVHRYPPDQPPSPSSGGPQG